MKMLNILLCAICLIFTQILFGQDSLRANPIINPTEPGKIYLPTLLGGKSFSIKSRSAQKCADVIDANISPGATVRLWELNATPAQIFTFEVAEGKEPGDSVYYYIRSNTGGWYLTLEVVPVINGVKYFLKQDILYPSNLGVVNKRNSQLWKMLPSDDPDCVMITNKELEGKMVLAPNSNNTGITAQAITGLAKQQWLLKPISVKEYPKSFESENGISQTCDYVATALLIFSKTLPLGLTLPEWRPVGEQNSPTQLGYRPRNSYETIEGLVTSAGVAFEDVPTTHYTHDFDFLISPDPPFKYLLADRGDKGFQTTVAVEWETGLGQGDDQSKNLAAEPNKKGESCGFFTVGHKRYDVIWNWPTKNDWVHVEGQWIWDRGHPPSKTEIHPPRFVAIQRNLPDKYTYSGRYYYATRCDMFASGDGNAIYNNRGLKPFVKEVRMSERNYFVIFKHLLPKPTANAQLQIAFKTRPGDNFPISPQTWIYSNGSADIPEPHIKVLIPWQSNQVSDLVVFARTMYIYWNDAPTHGVPANYSIGTYSATLEKILVKNKSDDVALPHASWRMFLNIGNNWLFLNEFSEVSDILSEGVGRATDHQTRQYHQLNVLLPPVIGAKDEFLFNQTMEIYLPPQKGFRTFLTGWEDDYAGRKFGILFSPYSTCDEAKKFLDDNFSGWEAQQKGKEDDNLGTLELFRNSNSIPAAGRTVTSSSSSGHYDAVFKFKKL